MAVLGHLEPKQVLSYFEQICAIPHGSRNNTAISNVCCQFRRSFFQYTVYRFYNL